MTRTLTKVIGLCLLLGSSFALASEPVRFGPNDVKTAFAIGKSDDGNQVQYAIRLDADCKPVGAEPVFGYWREYDKNQNLVPMGWLDQRGYGIDKQIVKDGRITMTIKTSSSREIELVPSKSASGECKAEAFTRINGKKALLKLIFLQLSGPFSVSWVELRGFELGTDHPAVERVQP